MTDRYRLIRTEYDGARYHLQCDTHAKKLNGFTVTLPPYVSAPGMLVEQRAGKTMDDAFREALTTLAFLRSEPFPKLYPADVFVPIGVITAVDCADVERDLLIKVALCVGGAGLTDNEYAHMNSFPGLHEYGDAAERRISALRRAVDLSRGAPLPHGLTDWCGAMDTKQ